MATRTVRLDEEAESTLRDIRQATGLPISEVLKRGLEYFRERLHEAPSETPYRVYERLDPGDGGYAIGPSTDVRRGVTQAVRRKLRR